MADTNEEVVTAEQPTTEQDASTTGDTAVVAELEPPLEDSTEGVPGGGENDEIEVDERLLQSASEGESGSDDLFRKDSSPEGGEEEEGEAERSRAEEGDKGVVQERVKQFLTKEKESQDLFVSVTEFDKQQPSKMDPFASYRVKTETSRSDCFAQREYEVWRRYKDFEWLREQLTLTYPTHIIPPLPGKQLLKYFDHFSYEFLSQRMKGLEKFLRRIAAHPIVSLDKNFVHFLTAKSPELTTIQSSSQGRGMFSAMSGMLTDASTKLRLKNPDTEFVQHAEYMERLAQQLATMETTASKLFAERKEYLQMAAEFAPSVKFWSNAEVILSTPLSQLAAAVESCNRSLKAVNDSSTQTVVGSTREYQLYCEAALSVLKHRNKLQLERDNLREEREKKQKAMGDPKVLGNAQKQEKLLQEFTKVNASCEAAIDKAECASSDLRADLDRWLVDKDEGIRELVRDMADGHMQYHEKCLNTWTELLKTFKDPASFTVLKEVKPKEKGASEEEKEEEEEEGDGEEEGEEGEGGLSESREQ